MEQNEEFNHYCLQQLKEEENPMIFEEQNDKDFNEKHSNF